MAKETNQVSGKNVNSFFDRGDGVIEFPNGLLITDDSMMWSGTKYDIDSLDISEYPGQLTLDHLDSIEEDCLIGKVEGVHKEGNKVLVDRIRYAINASKNALRAYELLRGGFSNAFSIETIGPWASDEDHTMYNHKLVGLSQVVMGNNKHAVANSIKATKVQYSMDNEQYEAENANECIAKHEVHVECEVETQVDEGENVATVEEKPAETEAIETNTEVEATNEEALKTLEDAKAEEVDNDAELEQPAEAEEPAEVAEEPSENTSDDGEEVVEESEEETEVKNEVETEETAEAEAEEAVETEEVEKVENAEGEEAETEAPAEKEETETEEAVADDTDEATEEQPTEEVVENNININKQTEDEMTKEEVSKLINEAFKNFAEAQAAAPVVEEPEVTETEGEATVENGYSLEKHANLVLRALKTKSALAYQELDAVNQKNLDALKAEGKVANSMTTADWGNFVLPPEMWTELVGMRTDYSAILEATNWRETDRLEFAWLTRNGDIEMQNVAACETHPVTSSNKNDNLKPISTYGAVQHIEQMEHLAAVTPVCSAATKYLVVDLIADAIAGYRNNYDKKRAELVIAKLQEAVNISGNKVAFDTTGTFDEKLATFIDAIAELSDTTSTGTFVFNQKTLLKIMEYVTPRESALGDRCFDTGKDGIKRIFGTPYVVVPNTLMPSLDGTAANPVISYIPVDASSTAPQNIEITSPVFYGDLSLFTGYTSGGLQFNMSEDAAYEDANGTVRSAYQRDEIVLRGYFWRGGAYRYPAAMAAITNEAISS